MLVDFSTEREVQSFIPVVSSMSVNLSVKESDIK